jgi:hypothetical protein
VLSTHHKDTQHTHTLLNRVDEELRRKKGALSTSFSVEVQGWDGSTGVKSTISIHLSTLTHEVRQIKRAIAESGCHLPLPSKRKTTRKIFFISTLMMFIHETESKQARWQWAEGLGGFMGANKIELLPGNLSLCYCFKESCWSERKRRISSQKVARTKSPKWQITKG